MRTTMNTRRQGCMALMAVALVVSWVGLASANHLHSKSGQAQVCQAAKLEAVGEKAECLAKEAADAVLGKTPDVAKCDREFTKAFEKAEKKAGGACTTIGDTAAIKAQVDTCHIYIAGALSGTPPPPPPACGSFPATGQQNECWNSAGVRIDCAGTGQDGDVKAGAVLSYTDNLDGTITDNNTGLMWEKKTTTCGGGIHCVNDTYTWAPAFTGFIATLNTVPCFAGHCDWRLPNVKELQSIVNYGRLNPAVSPVFNDDAGSGCSASCTAAYSYWTSSSYANFPSLAWFVHFLVGNVGSNDKSAGFGFVRAVRGGL